ncbi:MAG: TonB-dependent receptor [Prevotella sp.]|jgi:TonB-linked SusC/RagA family outer membrane protein|nr:TonB-dependent receptor [Prevotella sp.]MCH3995313.1 TonB-dependent receptor [Prevotella sp.]
MKRLLALMVAAFLSCGAIDSFLYASPAPEDVTQDNAFVKGRVVDEKGEPIVGASITEIGSTRGSITDADGNFSLKLAPGTRIQISYLGYKTVVVKATNGMKIQMATDNAMLDEVVAVGYGQQKKVDLTGSVANVDLSQTLSSRPEQDVAKALQGAVPGLSIVNTSGDINGQPTIRIRGLGTLSNGENSSPLIVVDGVPTDDLTMINGDDIASISVLKDAASSSIYGSRAAFGVILITTKQANKGDRISVKYENNFGWDDATVLPNFPDVPTQLNAAMSAKNRAGAASVELFGMYFDKLLPYAEKWKEQNSGKKGYSVMRPYKSDSDVGDYAIIDGQPMYYADYDLQKIWYNDAAPSSSHNVSISGSSGKTTFYTSLGYNYKQDVMAFNPGKLDRYNATVNLKTDATDWLTIGTRFNFTRRRMTSANAYNYIYQYIWRWGSFFIPSGIMDDAEGTPQDFRVVAMQKQASRIYDIHDVTKLNAYATAHITKDLTLNADYTFQVDNYNYSSSNHSVYGMNWTGTEPQYIVQPSTTNAYRQNIKVNRWTANAYLNYAHVWDNVHNLSVMLGINGEDYKSDMFDALRTQLYDENYPQLNLAYGDMTKAAIDASTGDRSTAGYFGRINYNYKDIYLLELNGRYDGSSRFPQGDKWAFFPSGSLGYRFTEEPYWNHLHQYISNGKLRLSYGEIGNEAVGDNMFISTISPVAQGSLYWLDGDGAKVNQFNMPSWVSSQLTWERIYTFDAGVDLDFFNDALSLTADWYQRTTKDMLAPGNALPSAVGDSAPYTNAGQLRTRGWEISLSWRKQLNKSLGLYANFNIGDSKTVVTKWNNTSKLIGHTEDRSYAYQGETWGDIWGFETDRYFTENDFNGQNADGSWNYKKGVADQTGIQTNNFVYGPGDIKFKDLNNDGKIDGGKGTVDDHGDLKVIGNVLPRYEYSFHIGGTFKGFDLDLFFQGVGKRDMWTLSSFVFPEMRSADLAIYSNQTKYNVYDPADGIVNISESNDFPCLYAGNEVAGNVTALASYGGSHNYYPQSKYLVNMSYLRMKNITLGYTLPELFSKKFYVQKLRVYFSGSNLFLLHKGSGDLPVDPEMNDGQGGLGNGTWGRTYPITRTWSFGVQVTL